MKWLNIIVNNKPLVPQNPLISGTYTYITMSYNQLFRIAQVQTSTGVNVKEASLDKFLPLATDTLSYVGMVTDTATQDLFLQLQIKSSYFTDASRNVVMIMKIDNTLVV